MVEIRVHADDADQRTDRYLRKLLRDAPLSLIHRLLRNGSVRVDGQRVEGRHRLGVDSRVELRMDPARFRALSGRDPAAAPAPPRDAPEPEALGLPLVHRDPDLWIVDKPAGLAVQGGSAVDDHIAGRLAQAFGGTSTAAFRPAPAHRIDRGTSGLLVCGITGPGLRGAAELFRGGAVEKVYLAVVEGHPEPRDGTIDLALIDRPNHARGPRARAAPDGLPAVTHYRTLARTERTAELEVVIETGRTHQIRAHLAAIGHPIVGDLRYGAAKDGPLPRGTFALHAHRLRFRHPVTATDLDVVAPRPRRFDVAAGGGC